MVTRYWIAALAFAASVQNLSFAATADLGKAEAARKKPLQRCDQLNDKAELECLKKARERIVEARKKREAAGQARGAGKAGGASDASVQPKRK